jgi:hypothetical protein
MAKATVAHRGGAASPRLRLRGGGSAAVHMLWWDQSSAIPGNCDSMEVAALHNLDCTGDVEPLRQLV